MVDRRTAGRGYFLRATGGISQTAFISHWDGVTWTDLPGLDPGNNDPYSTLFTYKGLLYSSGIFTGRIFPLARWDGTNWVDVAAPFYPHARNPVEMNGTLFVPGTLSTVMQSGAYGVAKYDAQEWTILGAGLPRVSDQPIRSLTVAGADLIAGGRFSALAGDQGSEIVARWNGKSWSRMGNGLRYFNICDTCASWALAGLAGGAPLYTGGTFLQFYDWDGTNWQAGPGVPNAVRAIAAAQGLVYAGGEFGILRGDTTNWTSLGAGIQGVVRAIALRGSEVFAGGNFTNSGGTVLSNIARWDGTNWNPIGAGLDGPVYALAFLGNNLVAGGAFNNAGGLLAPCVASWDGHSWASLGAGFLGGSNVDHQLHPLATSVNALAATPEGIIYAAGNFDQADGSTASFVAYWDGATWQPLGSGLDDVAYALALNGDDLYVGGDFTGAGGKPSVRLGLWHGGSVHPRPKLIIERFGTQVTIRWPASSTGFVLQCSQQLPGAGRWGVVPFNTQRDENVATNSVLTGSTFYRLIKQ